MAALHADWSIGGDGAKELYCFDARRRTLVRTRVSILSPRSDRPATCSGTWCRLALDIGVGRDEALLERLLRVAAALSQCLHAARLGIPPARTLAPLAGPWRAFAAARGLQLSLGLPMWMRGSIDGMNMWVATRRPVPHRRVR